MREQAVGPGDILNQVRQSPHQKVKVAIADIDGVLRGKYMHKEKFLAAVESGFGFCDVVFGWDCGDVCYDNVRYTGWHTGYPDAHARIDLATYRTIPWDNEVPFFLADFSDSAGEPLAVCPRQLLRRVVDRARDAGYQPTFAIEFEWFNFKESPNSLAEKRFADMTPLTPGMFGYSILRSSYSQDYFASLMDDLAAFGVPLEGLHTETGPGVYEAAIVHADALEAADRACLFKTAVKELGYRHGIVPSFMAKWNVRLPGCSGHLHQSLWNLRGERNLFFEPSAELTMSPIFQSYLAGQMRLAPELVCFYAPNVNSYKRLVEGMWAPTRVTWGADNRTSAFRVIPSSPKSTRLETRVTGADINPYLAIAAALASGLWGIENRLPLDAEPVTGNAYQAEGAERLPANLKEAADRLASSTIARELFGDDFVDHFAGTRHWEWRQYQQAVTDWELQRYFEII